METVVLHPKLSEEALHSVVTSGVTTALGSAEVDARSCAVRPVAERARVRVDERRPGGVGAAVGKTEAKGPSVVSK
jgi:hypothetical protein